MSILVTGGAGFVGVNVVQALLERGDELVVFDSGGLPAGAARALEPHAARLTLERGSVLEPERLDAVFRTHRVKRVIHCAAVTSGPAREARDPASIVDVNLQGTLNVLAAAREHAVQRLVYVGSGAAYGESLYRLPKLYEESPSIPTTLYSVTKHAAERVCMRMSALWELDVACVRLGTVIGPWERDTGARDNFGTHSQLAAMAVAGKTAVLTSRTVQRDWVYSSDVADALAALVHAPKLGYALYNVSSGAKWVNPIERWCETLSQAFPRFSYRVARVEEQANIWYTDRDRGLMDIGRLAFATGIRPRSMADAYAAYLEWLTNTPDFFSDVKSG